MSDALSRNSSLSHSERMEIFVLVLEPKWRKKIKELPYNPYLALHLFHILQRLQAFELELTAKAFNAYAKSTKIGKLDLMVAELRNARVLQGDLISLRQTRLPDHRGNQGPGNPTGLPGRLPVDLQRRGRPVLYV